MMCFDSLISAWESENDMYESEGKILGAATVAAPTFLILGVPLPTIIIVSLVLVLILTLFYVFYRRRNRKNR